ncbi:hypothetical protein pEaSNUABM28_00183 [Erwinia phage pEa_SNUABM_28]|uniref:Uncharacterized protein n=1 Tax=Erwinia phage pEa_SNUABM_16 TaxID=2869544 RepID=A0AAE9BTR0_9CAUD|nr:hypothetical protein MPK64_gp181 [Erwinia phage pEa_SNUABM_16]QZE58740.1 hypothetical protein pEaSNUABM28_00183 [Erwinia phage pEa_SNUABM_28]QZE59084.1 hypothetical protein pEaSNUABM18_00181 [Erwinia phage pEa_SNUABM_18]UAW96325.1 hypothetical protein pEaSNUABM16_00181 [Erwinia phage pEa_SNUABM_16]
MTHDVNTRLHSLLSGIATSDKRYANAAQGIIESISEAKEPIQLPDSVIELMGSSNVPEITPYDQNDLLLLLDALGKALLYVQSTPDTTPVDDGKYRLYLTEYRAQYQTLTNEQLTSVFTRDKFEGLEPLRAYALAIVLSDIAADRNLPVPGVWTSVIDNYIKLGE